jgi:hypothetical protein
VERYRQVPLNEDYRWPSGTSRAAAVFAVAPDVVTVRTGLAFEAGVDDLDYFRAVALDLGSGRRVLLTWYERSPVPGLVLEIDGDDDPEAARAETMEALGVTPEEVQWIPNSGSAAG